MKNYLKSVLAVVLLTSSYAYSMSVDERSEMDSEIKETVQQFKKVDSEIVKLFKSAKGYAVFPRIKKGGFGIGGARGRGQLFEGGNAIGATKVTQFTVGLQFGGQIYGEVIFFENETTLKNFKEGKLEFSAQVSAVAAAEGASKNAKYEHGVLVFTLAKTGLMYEASIGGQKFKFEEFE